MLSNEPGGSLLCSDDVVYIIKMVEKDYIIVDKEK